MKQMKGGMIMTKRGGVGMEELREVTPEMREALFGIPAKKFYSWRWRLKCWLFRWGLIR